MERPAHLSLILDLAPTQWHLSAQSAQHPPLSLSAFMSCTMAFVNAHVGGSHNNSLTVFGALPGKSVVLYAADTQSNRATAPTPDSSFAPFHAINSTVIQRVQEELELVGNPAEEEPTGLVGALTKALCYINRIVHPPQSTNPADVPVPRVLILSVSPDLSTSYIPLMNCIFSAQKLRAIIDVCRIYGPDAVFLQQAAHLTGGSYVVPERRDALLQCLVMNFLSSPAVRKFMAVATQEKIDFRAACFCHRHIIDVGYVCSVCLSIFCTPIPVCTTCKSRFPVKTYLRLKNAGSAPSLPSGSAAPSRASTPTRSSSPVLTVPTSDPSPSLQRQAVGGGHPRPPGSVPQRPLGNGPPRNGVSMNGGHGPNGFNSDAPRTPFGSQHPPPGRR